MTEEVIIDLKLDRNQEDFAELARMKGALVSLKEEQVKLTKSLKDEQITKDEYLRQSVKVEAALKKQQAAYSSLQRNVTGLKNPFDKLNESIKAQASQVNIAGISLATFANPITATVGLLGGLFKAYSSSTIGAKDLENATNQLGAGFNFMANQVARLVSGEGEGGEGLFSKLAFAFNAAIFGMGAATTGAVFAAIQERLEDLGRDEVRIRSEVNQRLEDNAVILAQMADSQVDINEKTALAGEAIRNLRKNEEELLAIKQEQLDNLNHLLGLDTENEKLQDAVLEKEQEISNIKRDTERRVQAIVKLESNILDAKNKQLSADQKAEQIRLKKLQDEEAEKKEKLSDEGLIKEMDRLAELQKLREENSSAAFQAEWDEKVRIAKEANDEIERQSQAAFEKDKERQIAKVDFYRTLTQDLTRNLIMGIKDVTSVGEQMLKSFLIMGLRALKQFLMIKVVGESLATWDSILTFGLSGAIGGAIMASLIEGAFAGFESLVAGFAEGGRLEPHHGTPIRRKNGDNRVVTAKVGEVILNERQQAALGGPNTFARIGVPGFSSSNLGQNEFAIGGRIPFPDDTNRLLLKAMREMQIAVVIEDVERKNQRRAQIRERATL